MTLSIPDALGTQLFGVAAAGVSKEKPYHYAIYSQTFIIREIRIGRAKTDDCDFKEYGPGEITYLCENTRSGKLIACSPVGNELVGISYTAGRAKRLYRNQRLLKGEAETVRRDILKNYRDVGAVDISLNEENL